jgi:hypothetical protein
LTIGKPHKIGNHGAGTLSCISNEDGLLLLFNASPIAKRLPGRWISLDRAWKVTPAGVREICIQHNGGDGVFVSLGGGNF